jgi:hypothetical protein
MAVRAASIDYAEQNNVTDGERELQHQWKQRRQNNVQ